MRQKLRGVIVDAGKSRQGKLKVGRNGPVPAGAARKTSDSLDFSLGKLPDFDNRAADVERPQPGQRRGPGLKGVCPHHQCEDRNHDGSWEGHSAFCLHVDRAG